MSCYQDPEESDNINTADKSFENVGEIKYLEVAIPVINKNYKDPESRYNLGN
jgi:hypothetical protein